ncbi:hypothetical protein EVAR_52648_1 [Eumeta japonica]|uniref:Helitron helicase-like domain-containing protein n=1 Tax=Eumeta variegata TaxID=151549 RepID=A0A4C1Y1Q7_EUMVA|nr:hypothetical protein EVAR_52648_1 [Eumeta japonica]
MPRRRRPDLGRRSQSNVRRATSRANRTDDQRETDQENSRIAMSELRYLFSDNEVDRLRMQRVRAHQTQQQRTRHNEIERIRRRSAPVILERAAFHYDPAIDYCADKSVTIGEMKIVCKYYAEVDNRCAHNPTVKRTIVQELQMFLHQNNNLVNMFKIALDRMPSDSHNIIIRADKTPAGEHTRRFNSPTIDEVAVVIVGENLQSRDIVLHRRNSDLKRVSETHRSYDGLQYPLIFWQGEDGYHFNIKMVNPVTGAEINKKVSAMNFYSYRFMIRQAEIPDETVDPKLHAVVTKHMIHGPCGLFNYNSPCMVDGKCSKRYPRDLLAETITK